jgi:hypothetical protein
MMSILPYMKQLPQDFFKNNYPVAPTVVAAPVEPEVPYVFPEPILGEPLPPPSGGGIPEAPTDGGTYARQSTAWTKNWDGGSY